MTVRKSTDGRSSGGTAQGMTWDHPKKGRLLRAVLMAVVLAVMSAAPAAAEVQGSASVEAGFSLLDFLGLGKSWS